MKIDPKILQNLELQSQEKREDSVKKPSLLGIDYGEKLSGIAISPDGICAFPLKIVKTETLASSMLTLLEEKKIKKIIFGLPLSSDNYENKVCLAIRKFAKKFEKESYEVIFQNERFSSQNTFSRKKGERIDDLAAAKILEFYISTKS